tara:strand:- start:87 stop:602 length:516 start_codon:yes stop_codon:yes gene_type:complete
VAKRGRPKKPKPQRDYGTPELIAKKLEQVGENFDPTMSSSVLDIHKAKNLISTHEHISCMTYLFLYTYIFGKVHVASNMEKILTFTHGIKENKSDHESAFDQAVARDFKKMDKHLSNISLNDYTFFKNIVVYDVTPIYFKYKIITNHPLYRSFKRMVIELNRYRSNARLYF